MQVSNSEHLYLPCFLFFKVKYTSENVRQKYTKIFIINKKEETTLIFPLLFIKEIIKQQTSLLRCNPPLCPCFLQPFRNNFFQKLIFSLPFSRHIETDILLRFLFCRNIRQRDIICISMRYQHLTDSHTCLIGPVESMS